MSVGTVALLMMILIAYDSRVRDLVSRRVVANPSLEAVSAGHRINDALTFVASVVRSQSTLHGPLLIFTVAAAVLTIFMLRT
jgi:hypothetical protein